MDIIQQHTPNCKAHIHVQCRNRTGLSSGASILQVSELSNAYLRLLPKQGLGESCM